jgi:hypothetical protein
MAPKPECLPLPLPSAAGVPIIADRKFMAAYSMIEPNAVFPQEDGRNELDIMFNVARMTPEEMWRTRLGEQCRATKVGYSGFNTSTLFINVGCLKPEQMWCT